MSPNKHDQKFVSMVIIEPIKLAIKTNPYRRNLPRSAQNPLRYFSEVTGNFNKVMNLDTCDFVSKCSPCHKH